MGIYGHPLSPVLLDFKQRQVGECQAVVSHTGVNTMIGEAAKAIQDASGKDGDGEDIGVFEGKIIEAAQVLILITVVVVSFLFYFMYVGDLDLPPNMCDVPAVLKDFEEVVVTISLTNGVFISSNLIHLQPLLIMRTKLPRLPWRTNCGCRFPGTLGARLCRTLTEIEHRDDGAFKRYLPGPKTGGFARGSFIAWRRHERVRDIEVVKDSIRELYDFEEALGTRNRRVVGEGGFGQVSRARHRRTGEVVAIKTISKSKLGDEEALQLEVAFLKLSDHPNTVRYYETFEDATDIHLVMETELESADGS
eukprot:s875_g16.t1